MATFTKTVTTKTNAYTVAFDDGTEISRNAKKDYAFAIVYMADGGHWAGQWKLHGLASDASKAAKAESACHSDFREFRRGSYVKKATPVVVSVLPLTA